MQDWTSLGPLPGFALLSKSLTKERQRIDEAIERVAELRAIADQADEERAVLWRRDANTCDQSHAPAAQIGALEHRVAGCWDHRWAILSRHLKARTCALPAGHTRQPRRAQP